ncbi:hypothetical protein HJ205_23350 [Vibrio parahaemolyticus]|nr:hypothetical protein [Vibrio parahaemolyticus]HCE3689864.1 hypothetical protein [Vibrio parahaemolyticus]
MKKIWNELILPFIKRWLLAPFSNKVTKMFLYTGAAIVAAPLIEHLIIKVVLLKLFDIDIPIDVPDVPAYVAGVALMFLGGLHNIGFQYINYVQTKYNDGKALEVLKSQQPHDKKIIDELLVLLPYENTHHWLEQAGYAGLRRDFSHDLQECEKFNDAPYKVYNQIVEAAKTALIDQIQDFNVQCMGHLGAQEDTTGEMYLPPYHWKSQGKESEARYYEQVKGVSESGQKVRTMLDQFIEVVKKEGFII